MPEFGFYHLTRSPLEQALPRLLEKMLATGKRSLLRLGQKERLEYIDRALWTYRPDSWLPHGTDDEPYAEFQPILLSTKSAARDTPNPNAAAYLMLIDGADATDADEFERVLEIFDGNNQTAVQAARQRWVWARSKDFDCVYWQQNERGGWRKANQN